MGLITLSTVLVLLCLMYRKRTKIFLFILVFFLSMSVVFSTMIIWRFARLQSQSEFYGEVLRYTAWKSAVRGWLEHPLFGVGVSKVAIYKTMEKQGAMKYDREKKIEVPKAPHSVYLNTLLETGVVGFAALGLFLYLFLLRLKKSLKRAPPAGYLHDFMKLAFISLLSSLLMGITANSIWLNIFWYILGLGCAGTLIIDNSNKQRIVKK